MKRGFIRNAVLGINKCVKPNEATVLENPSQGQWCRGSLWAHGLGERSFLFIFYFFFSTGWNCFIGTKRGPKLSVGWRLSTFRGPERNTESYIYSFLVWLEAGWFAFYSQTYCFYRLIRTVRLGPNNSLWLEDIAQYNLTRFLMSWGYYPTQSSQNTPRKYKKQNRRKEKILLPHHRKSSRSSFIVAMMKHSDQKQLEGGEALFQLKSQCTIEASQGRNWSRSYGGTLLIGLFSHLLS